MMNTRFKSALDKIEAEDELVKKTEIYLREKYQHQQGLQIKRRMFTMKKLLVASLAIVFMSAAFIGGNAFLNTPVAYISLDINPSIELGVNALNKVVTAEGVNDDGEAMLADIDVINNNLSEALGKLIDTAAEKDFIKEDGTTVVSITAESNNDSKAENLTDIGEQAVNTAMGKSKFNAIVYKDCSDLALRTEAKDLGISPGKYKLIKNVQALDPTITIDELKDAKVSDIMLRANQLIDELDTENTECPEEQQRAVNRMKDAAKKTEERFNNSVKAEFEAAKDQAKAAFDEAKNQAISIVNDAKDQAKQLNAEADALLEKLPEMTEEEKAEAVAKAEELKKQAESLVEEAVNKAQELKDAAEQQKEEAIEEAAKIKEAAEAELDKAKGKKEEKNKNGENKGNNGNKGNSGKDESCIDDITDDESEAEVVESEAGDIEAESEIENTNSKAPNNNKGKDNKSNNGKNNNDK